MNSEPKENARRRKPGGPSISLRKRGPASYSGPAKDSLLERKGHFLVYTGNIEPFDAGEVIREVREERTP
ncbi:MAG TPA: hypothetical protein VFG50_11195 [Rhodothermales bacterium]|nr:hypothetical protein [Rhodothermales bacterium]